MMKAVIRIITMWWTRFWMTRSGLHAFGRLATRLAIWFAPPHKSRIPLAHMTPRGYISPEATVHHSDLRLGRHVFVDDRVVLYQRENGGRIQLGDNVSILRDSILETGHGGYLVLGEDASIHPRCQLNAYLSPITIGKRTMVAPACAFYPYDHGVLPGIRISEQPITSKGAISVGDDAWIGFGSIILGGVRIGNGAVVGAGSVVTKDVPDGGIVTGNPARLVKMRDEIGSSVSKAETGLSIKGPGDRKEM